MSILGRVRRKLIDLLISEVPGPYPDTIPPDADGRRDADAPGPERAALDAQLQARGSAGMGGTVVSGPHDGFGPPGTGRR